jgi:hypothetical protein
VGARDRVLVHMKDFAVSDAYSSEPCNKGRRLATKQNR